MPDGMLMSKAVLFIDVDGLFMCTGAWVEAALTFSISVLLYNKGYMMYTCTSLSLGSSWMILKYCCGEMTTKSFLCLKPIGSISPSVLAVSSAAKTNWQSWMHILAELCSSPQNEDTQPHIKFWNPLVKVVGLDKQLLCVMFLQHSGVLQTVQPCAF